MSAPESPFPNSPQLLSRLLRTLPGMVYRCRSDPSWSMAYVSDGCFALTGYHPQQLIDDREVAYAHLIHPEDRDRVWAALQEALAAHRPFEMVYRIQDAQQQEKWVWEQGQGVFSEEQHLIAVEGFITDMTAQKRLEVFQQTTTSALETTQRFLQSVLENLPVAVIAKDAAELRFVLWNKAAEHLFHRPLEEVIGRTGYDIFPPAIAQTRRKRDRLALQSDTILHTPAEETLIDGNPRILQTWQTRILDPEGHPQYLLTIADDITEQERLKALQQQAETRLRTYSQALGQLVRSKLREQGDLEASLSEITEVACQTLPVAIAEIWLFAENRTVLRLEKGSPAQQGTHSRGGDLAATEYPQYFQALATARLLAVTDAWTDPRTCEFRAMYLEPFGVASLLDAPIWSGGEMVGVLCLEHQGEPRTWTVEEENFASSLADFVSLALETWNRRQAEAALRQKTAHLEQALYDLKATQTQLIQSEKMSSLGQLVAGVAHEINNPVNFIAGNLDPAQRYIQDLLTLVQLYQDRYPEPGEAIAQHIDEIDLDFVVEDLPRLFKSMQVGTDRIQNIVKSLRTFSRMDEAAARAVNLHEGIESTLMILQNRLTRKTRQPEIRLYKEYGPLPPVECYAGPLNQVFMNLLSNAIDALEEKLAIAPPSPTNLWVPYIRIVTEEFRAGWVRIRVADNGPGLHPQAQQQLFMPFFTTKPLGKGTGLGLSISHQIVTQKHGGTLQCLSQAGEGVEFVIEIPTVQSRPMMAAIAPKPDRETWD